MVFEKKNRDWLHLLKVGWSELKFIAEINAIFQLYRKLLEIKGICKNAAKRRNQRP
jgi:hypothetical protein